MLKRVCYGLDDFGIFWDDFGILVSVIWGFLGLYLWGLYLWLAMIWVICYTFGLTMIVL